jgi:peptidoglycan/LPS O-acetylase OafA/YrhL
MDVTAKPAGSYRIPALDFTKGALVLIMIFYHWLNYFIGPNLDYRYLRFLTPSFIFVSGFLISHVYLSRYSAADPQLSRRLFMRGGKLWVVFIVLNLVRTLLVRKLPNASAMADQLTSKNVWDVCVIGNASAATAKVVAFYILIPISYLLVFSAALVFLYGFYKYTFHAVCVLLLSSILILGLNGLHSPNLEFVTIGLLGVLAGFTSIQKINKLVGHPYVLLVAYLCYLTAITMWNVPFALLVVGVCLSLSVIYLIGLRDSEASRLRRHITLLGRHSLFGYVAQIAILQALSGAARHVNSGVGIIAICFVAAFALTMASVEVVEWFKARSIIVDRLYKVAFA